MIARFRADYAHSPTAAGFKELIEEFTLNSELFRETWPRHDVQFVSDCHKRWHDLRIGEMEFEQVTLQQPTDPELRIILFTASADTAVRLQCFLDSRTIDSSL